MDGLMAGWLDLSLYPDGQGAVELMVEAGTEGVRFVIPEERYLSLRGEESAPPVDLTGRAAPPIRVGDWAQGEGALSTAGGKPRVLVLGRGLHRAGDKTEDRWQQLHEQCLKAGAEFAVVFTHGNRHIMSRLVSEGSD